MDNYHVYADLSRLDRQKKHSVGELDEDSTEAVDEEENDLLDMEFEEGINEKTSYHDKVVEEDLKFGQTLEEIVDGDGGSTWRNI
ncbi:hypothetical protein L1987_14546 [Smallanthus sonchifolius]|uniref:Uncharacterized protein n=1 Tax=Smallanthus sonchifolius TaxID=185202 RepID=A0ACB9J310_9ASTR|nr:hypothetical protein L1987_14546 [Smallanthus sonchifolius]